jgi:hypothetical protein
MADPPPSAAGILTVLECPHGHKITVTPFRDRFLAPLRPIATELDQTSCSPYFVFLRGGRRKTARVGEAMHIRAELGLSS